MDKGNTTTFS